MVAVLLILLLVLLAVLVTQHRKATKKEAALAQSLATAEEQHQAGAVREVQLREELAQLSAYRVIPDANQYAQQIRATADVETQAQLARAQREADTVRTAADTEARTVLTRAHQEAGELRATATQELASTRAEGKQMQEQAGMKARVLQTQADNLLLNASREAARIVATANQRAEEIAGEALAAARNATGLEKIIQALKNTVNGYGDQYLVPSYTLLDELAADFGHTEAGEELKKARERTRLMVRARTAAKCGYVEAVRSTSAENFVTDAFNGKVDTILTSVKHDNVGTLTQQIKDAYALVNNLGKPFKDAHIAPEYLAARLEELRWATVAHELKLREREEQRQIREQIREEEKARREFEKAQRDAAKQEETIQKTIDRVQQQAAKASEAQREAFEAQLRELEGKLRAAQEKNQRALSMAQQTKSGHVYVISNIGSFGEHVYKIGMTRRLEPLDRVRELGDASVPFAFDVHALLFSDDAPALERDLHRHFLRCQLNKANPRKEFFRVDLAQIRAEIERLGIATQWTLAAEAREYRESLAIEQALANNTLDQAEWEKFQLENAPSEAEVAAEEQEA
ncbi:DUF4041 domain-containing protein [Hymenobacter nivis]|uniref:DUF4041 domain-containing protein n=1 Tax=Hymenobacter nivis TaxID=1850093 RepID=A0A2Z3GJF7_9BACT|nr:DUF4041 domain-containing protein [Hymenobacter nivis]